MNLHIETLYLEASMLHYTANLVRPWCTCLFVTDLLCFIHLRLKLVKAGQQTPRGLSVGLKGEMDSVRLYT